MNENVDLFIIEDCQDMREILVRVFQGSGVTLNTFSTAEEALVAFKDRACKVILTDLNLPGMSGDELAARVRLLCPKTIIFAMTGNHNFGEEVKFRFDKVFNKPFILSQVLGHIVRAVHEPCDSACQ